MVLKMQPGHGARFGDMRLLATDIDGTLLRTDATISARMQATLARAQAAGIVVALATARPPRTLRVIAQEVGVGGLALACNGAILYDLARDAIVAHRPIAPEVSVRVITTLRAALPGIAFACEAGLRFGCEPAYEQLRPYAKQQSEWRADALALAEEPITKLIALHPTLTGDELLAETQALVGDDVFCTHSGLPIVEMSAPGVDKAAGVAALAERLGLPRATVVACGDMPTDLPMLRWATLGVAVANAHPDLLAEADAVTASNDEDGVALVLEAMMGEHSML